MKWHPFAEKFPLLEGEEWESFKESIRHTRGNETPIIFRTVKGQKEGLDGRNRERACKELGLKCREEEEIVDDAEVKAWIIRRNVDRRHLTRELRKALVAELRADGQSTRQIAETLGVDPKTVRNDLAETAGGENSPPDTSADPDWLNEIAPVGESSVGDEKEVEHDAKKPRPKVTGKDGKEYAATKPALRLCGRCTRAQRVGQTPPKNCEMCRELRGRKAKPKEEPAGKPDDDARADAFGNSVPKDLRAVFFDPWIQRAIDTIGVLEAQFRAAKLADGMHKRKAKYPFLNAKDFIDGCGMVMNTMEQLVEHLKDNRPAGVCPACQGKKCAQCNLSGMVPRELYGKLKKKVS